MFGSLHKWVLLPLLLVLLTMPIPASAQGNVILDTCTVQLWPEFDQPAMLVIYDFTLAEGTSLPVDITLRIPTDATLIAVANAPVGNLLNVPYQDPYEESGWQVVAFTIDTDTTYRIEYYAPLTRIDTQREYVYLWPGDYTVGTFNVSVRIPADTTEVTTDPQMRSSASEDNTQTSLEWETSNLEAGTQLPIKLTYSRTSDQLSVSNQPLETGTVDKSTQGRISLNNYLPYILGGLGVLLIVGGGIYFWQTSREKPTVRKRHRTRDEDHDSEDVYCHQCGKRAQPSDRFCRTCGTRLRKES